MTHINDQAACDAADAREAQREKDEAKAYKYPSTLGEVTGETPSPPTPPEGVSPAELLNWIEKALKQDPPQTAYALALIKVAEKKIKDGKA